MHDLTWANVETRLRLGRAPRRRSVMSRSVRTPQVQTGPPRIMATLLAIGLIRQAGYRKIAASIRRIKHDTGLLLAILGLKTPA